MNSGQLLRVLIFAVLFGVVGLRFFLTPPRMPDPDQQMSRVFAPSEFYSVAFISLETVLMIISLDAFAAALFSGWR